MRTVSVHPKSTIRFTESARIYCNILNEYKKQNPDATFKEMSKEFGLSETNCRRYYYGIHHTTGATQKPYPIDYTRMREGACVTI